MLAADFIAYSFDGNRFVFFFIPLARHKIKIKSEKKLNLKQKIEKIHCNLFQLKKTWQQNNTSRQTYLWLSLDFFRNNDFDEKWSQFKFVAGVESLFFFTFCGNACWTASRFAAIKKDFTSLLQEFNFLHKIQVFSS